MSNVDCGVFLIEISEHEEQEIVEDVDEGAFRA